MKMRSSSFLDTNTLLGFSLVFMNLTHFISHTQNNATLSVVMYSLSLTGVVTGADPGLTCRSAHAQFGFSWSPDREPPHRAILREKDTGE